VYAHVATDPGYPGRLALQYWLFYVYNDWNNLHEGDWEMIQLVFDAGSARDALDRGPPLWVLNTVAGVVYAVAMPFVALTTAYLYFDARARDELAEREPDQLPADRAVRLTRPWTRISCALTR
jgi:hypothetical protein